MQNLGYTYTFKIAVYLKCQFNWVSCLSFAQSGDGLLLQFGFHNQAEISEIIARQKSKATPLQAFWAPNV